MHQMSPRKDAASAPALIVMMLFGCGGTIVPAVLTDGGVATSKDGGAFTPKEACVPEPHPAGHLGHSPYRPEDDPTEHDKCADGFPPNDFWWPEHEAVGFGHDAVARSPGGRSANFDAFRFRRPQDGRSIAVEIKTNALSSYPNEFVRMMEIQQEVEQILRHAQVAADCNWEYWVRVKDPVHRTLLLDARAAGRIPMTVDIDQFQSCPTTRPPNPLPYPFQP